jgi:hypothetical protein
MLDRWREFVDRIGERRIVWVLVAVAFVLQIVFLRDPVIYGEPYLIAKNIVAGKGYVFTYPLTSRELVSCYATPLYTYLQAGILWSGIGERGIQVVNLIALAAAYLVIYRLLRRFASASVAIPALAALAFYPPLWVLGNALEPNTLNVLLLALTIEAILDLAAEPTRRRWITLGILFGIQLLLRPDILLGMTLFGGWLLYVRRSDLVRTAYGLVLTALIGLAIVSPWTIRNYLEFHKFVLVSANAGYNLYVGNNPGATGEFAVTPLPSPEVERQYQDFLNFSMTHDQVEMDSFEGDVAKQWIRTHPGDVVTLDARKFLYHWFGRNELGTQYHYAQGAFSALYKVLSAVMLLLAVYALWRMPNSRLRSLLGVLALYSTLVSVIFFVQSRHRTLKIDPFMVPLATMGLLTLAAKRSDTRSPFYLQIAE